MLDDKYKGWAVEFLTAPYGGDIEEDLIEILRNVAADERAACAEIARYAFETTGSIEAKAIE